MQTSEKTSPSADVVRVMIRDGMPLGKIIASFDAPTPPQALSTPTVAPVPSSPVLTDEIRQALLALPRVFDKVTVKDRRVLTVPEVVSLHAEYTTLKTIGDTLKKRLDVVNENIRSHVDVQAEQDGTADQDTPRDTTGHYILAAKGKPIRVPVKGSNEDFSLEYRSGRAGTVTVSSERLLDLYEDGKITREQYLAVTREVRIFDEAKATEAILKDPSLIDVVSDASVRTGQTAPGQSLYLRNRK